MRTDNVRKVPRQKAPARRKPPVRRRPSLIGQVQRQVAPRKPVAGPPTPKKLRGPVNQGRARRQQIAINHVRNLVGPPSPKKAGPPTPSRAVIQKNLQKQAARERKRLGLSTHVALDNARSRESLLQEIRTNQRATSRKHPIAFGLLGSHQEFYDRKTGKKIPSSSPRHPGQALIKLSTDREDVKKMTVAAPVLKVLDQTTRPIHAIAAGSNAALKGKNVLRAAGRGFQNKDKTLFSDVLKTAHAPKILQGPLGFGLDVGLDPTTYITGGSAPVLKKAAADAARKATEEALAKGAAKDVANRAGRQAAHAVLQKGHRPGVQINVAGKKAATIRTTKKGAARYERAHASKPVQLVRHVNPNIRPRGVSRDDWERARDATRRERAISATGETHARNRAIAVSKVLGHDEKAHHRVTDAVEARDLDHLAPKERKVAEALIHDYEEMFGKEKAAKLIHTKLGDLGYLPRHHDAELMVGRKAKKGMGGAQLEAASMRTERRARKDFRGTEDDVYVGDLAVSRYLRGRDSAVKLGRASTYKELRGIGKPYKGQALSEHEGLYRFVGNKKPEKLEGDALKAALRGKAADGKVMVLNDHLANRTLGPSIHRLEDLEDIGALWDRAVQGRIKTILTVPNPQYHLTNLYGDLTNAYLGQNVASLAKHMSISVAALRAKAKREAAIRTLDKQIDPRTRGVLVTAVTRNHAGTAKIGKERVGYDDLIREAEQHGAINQGFIGRDLPEVLDAQGKQTMERLGKGRVASKMGKAGRRIGQSRIAHPIDSIRDASQYREDAVRLATYLGARKKGLTADEASAYVAKHHFDYGDLSQFERSVMRRVFPFYTFTARNTPLQVKSLITRPGKFANVQKAREELGKAAGLPDDWEKDLSPADQRRLVVPIPGKKDKYGRPLTIGYNTPISDLNRLNISPTMKFDEAMSLLSPIVKTPSEILLNYSFYFRDPIDKLAGHKDPVTGKEMVELQAVPKWLGNAPFKNTVSKLLGVREFTVIRKVNGKDVRTKALGIPKKTAYALSSTPESSNLLQVGTGTENPRGQTGGQRALGYLTGIKVAPIDKPKGKEQSLYERRAYLQSVADGMRRQENPGPAYVNGDPTRRTPAYQKVLDETAQVEKKIGIRAGSKKPTGALFNDPEIQQALKQHQANKAKQQGIMADPEVKAALEKLKAGG